MINSKIYFVTGNKIKFEEIKLWLYELDASIELEQIKLDLPEIQSLDLKEVALAKAQAAWQLLKKPLLVDDEGLFIHCYNNFPGALTRYVYEGIGLHGIWLLAQKNPSVSFSNCLVYCKDETSQIISFGSTEGILMQPKTISFFTGNAITELIIPTGYRKNLADIKQSDDGKIVHYRYKALQQLVSQIL